jgi:ArsR family transcriptional regulator
MLCLVAAEISPELASLIARRFATLGEPTRVRLLNAMHSAGEASVGALAEAVGGTQANVSKHLNLLLAERMVARRREGTRALYRIADPTLIRLCDEVCAGVEQQLLELSSVVGAGRLGSAS